ncbi:cell division protein FtsL [Caenibacillus caldisaponilyticus]|uniref:cell division protein FtsL n=1 Tax=Caenibacillus caldisaponilyticus TaxID=1674942 RepID=UPI0013018CA3|nr:cell division protein FtsL [Caenibacillus caldisaponilyticus]
MSQVARQMAVHEAIERRSHARIPSTFPKKRITKGEKLLWSLALVVVMALSLAIISMQARIYIANRAINDAEAKIEKATEENQRLTVEKTKLSDPKRLMEYAKKHGYSLNINNVKVIK